MKYRFYFSTLMVLFSVLFIASGASAQETVINLVLFKGKVELVDTNGTAHTATIGQIFNTNQFPKVRLILGASLYLKQGKRLVELNRPGEFLIADLFAKNSSPVKNAIAFLKSLSQPRVYTKSALVRGKKGQQDTSDEAYFELLWERIVLEPTGQPSDLSPEDLLACAAWYSQNNKPTRVAYILERLSNLKAGNNEFYQQMRMESLRGIRLADINREVESTRQKISTDSSTLRYKALLIGINEYNHPAWQSLKNPISDIQSIRRLLIAVYNFNDSDIVLLENASYDQIIEAFNNLKGFVGEDTSLLVYYAGHGYYPPDEGEGYWIPRDAGEPESLRLFLPTTTVLGKIKSIKTKHTLLIADSCFSGSLIRKTRGVESNSRFYRDLSQKKSRQIITSGGLEPVDDQGAGKHSIFAGKLIDILSADRQEPLSASELAFQLRKEVKNAWSNQTPEYGRLQIADDERGEFFFVQLDNASVVGQKEAELEPAGVAVVPVPVPRMPKQTSYSYDHLPRGVCLAPKPFTDLRKCSFRGKKIEDISLEGANLQGVDFRYVKLSDVNLKGANLRKTDWRYSDIDGLYAPNIQGRHSDWRYTDITDSDFSHSDLSRIDLRYTNLQDVKLDYADLTGGDIRFFDVEDVSMEGTNLTKVNSNSDKLFGQKIIGIIEGVGGALEGALDKFDETEEPVEEVQDKPEPQQNQPGPESNRQDSILYLGIKPISFSMPRHELRPFNLGFYIGDMVQLGLEYGQTTKKKSNDFWDIESKMSTGGIYLRLFPVDSFNLLFAFNQLSMTNSAQTQTDSDSGNYAEINETEKVIIHTVGIGNQWLFDSGITLGVDWGLYSRVLVKGDPETTVENKGVSATEIAYAESEIDELEKDMEKEKMFSNRDQYLSLSIGYSF